MPLILFCIALAYAGVRISVEKDKGKTYGHNDIDNMLREMTGKSKAEKRRILKKYGKR
ncbi:hypothetical protein IJ556_03290 [bacterium]|nr:hypothetical protein [bacterium]